jgi:hypothetical protein
VRACAVEMQTDIAQQAFSAEIHWEMPDATWTPGHTVWEIKTRVRFQFLEFWSLPIWFLINHL